MYLYEISTTYGILEVYEIALLFALQSLCYGAFKVQSIFQIDNSVLCSDRLCECLVLYERSTCTLNKHKRDQTTVEGERKQD